MGIARGAGGGLEKRSNREEERKGKKTSGETMKRVEGGRSRWDGMGKTRVIQAGPPTRRKRIGTSEEPSKRGKPACVPCCLVRLEREIAN
jgi:hypothetical protein